MGSLEVCCRTDTGNRKSVNEDSLLRVNFRDVHLLAVADGLGGHAAGKVASRVALVEIEEFLKTHFTGQNLLGSIREAVSKANKEIYLLSKENPAYAGMGSTLVAAAISQNKAVIANVGDSRAYLVGNEIRQVTKDHSLVQELVDKRVITQEETFNHPQKNIVTRALGIKSEVLPDFYEVELSGKLLLLCSDGLSDSLKDEEIRKTIAASINLDEACNKLISLANEKGGSDNITVILAKKNTDNLRSWTFRGKD